MPLRNTTEPEHQLEVLMIGPSQSIARGHRRRRCSITLPSEEFEI